jgi:hypothetical protein
MRETRVIVDRVKLDRNTSGAVRGHADVVQQVRGLFGALSDDEVALVRAVTPPEVAAEPGMEHLFEVMDLLSTIRKDEAMAEYVFAVAPRWDGTIAALLLAGWVTTACSRYELGRRVPELA